MSKTLLLLLSIFLMIGLYTVAVKGCAGGWCHPQQNHYCCPGYACNSHWLQGSCVTQAEHDYLAKTLQL